MVSKATEICTCYGGVGVPPVRAWQLGKNPELGHFSAYMHVTLPTVVHAAADLFVCLSLQVAEDCILKWMRRFVKPVLQVQIRKEQLRKHTVSLDMW